MTKIRSQITREILETVREENKCGKDDIAEATGLEKDIMEEYLSKLVEEGFLNVHHSKSTYKLTDNGKSLLDSFGKLDDITSISIIF